jgi:hypothetical protein
MWKAPGASAPGTFHIKTHDRNPLNQTIGHKYCCPAAGLGHEENATGWLE